MGEDALACRKVGQGILFEEGNTMLPAHATRPRDCMEMSPGLQAVFDLIQRAMLRKGQIWGRLPDGDVRFCPYALGWRGAEPYVLGLQPELFTKDHGWGWHFSWKWIRLADLQTPLSRLGSWVPCPQEHRPPVNFLTHIYCEIE
jgi:hypothetical protein